MTDSRTPGVYLLLSVCLSLGGFYLVSYGVNPELALTNTVFFTVVAAMVYFAVPTILFLFSLKAPPDSGTGFEKLGLLMSMVLKAYCFCIPILMLAGVCLSRATGNKMAMMAWLFLCAGPAVMLGTARFVVGSEPDLDFDDTKLDVLTMAGIAAPALLAALTGRWAFGP